MKNFNHRFKPALRELAARSGRIVEFGDGDADEGVLSALKAVASADESPAQRAMLLKRGLIEMVKGQVVINERGYEMMQKAGVPPKLTPEERREEITGTEEKRLSRFDHRGHREHRVEFAAGDQILKLGFKAASAKGVHPYEAAAMAQTLHGPILATAMTKKVGKGGLMQRAERKASARMIREYRGMLRRGAKREFARGDNFRRVTKLVEYLAPGSGSMQVGGFGHWSQVPSFAAERGSKVASGQAGWLKVFRPKVKPTGQTMNVGGKVWHENAGEWPYRSASGLGLAKRHNALYTPEKRGF